MNVSTPFAQLLETASAQADPPRLLFVFAEAQLPPDATPEQHERFQAGQGGTLTPLACVDKAVGDLSTFEAMVAESRDACSPWQVMFIAALPGQDGKPPSSALVDSALHAMVESIRIGRIGKYMALSPTGEPLVMS